MCVPTSSEGPHFPALGFPPTWADEQKSVPPKHYHRSSSQAETQPHPFESRSPVAMISLLIHTSLLSINQDPAKRPVWESRLLPLRNLFQNPWPRNCRNSRLPRKTLIHRRGGMGWVYASMTRLDSTASPPPTVHTEAWRHGKEKEGLLHMALMNWSAMMLAGHHVEGTEEHQRKQKRCSERRERSKIPQGHSKVIKDGPYTPSREG